MKTMRIQPGLLAGTVPAPPSKSMAHRLCICAALAEGKSRITGIDPSDDILATLKGLRALGAEWTFEGDTLILDGASIQTGTGDGEITIDCNESGSTLRFLVPLALTQNRPVRFIGRGNLHKRPMTVYRDIARAQDIRYEEGRGEHLDLLVQGRLTPGTYAVPGDISSQFITGLLLALPVLEGDSDLVITTPMESKGYLDLTLSALFAHGIQVENQMYQRFHIPGRQRYRPRDGAVEGDYSQAAFYLVADALGSRVSVTGLDSNSAQGDRAILDILSRMGCRMDGGAVLPPKRLTATHIDGSQCPDIVPIAALAACLCHGETKITGAARLRIKECDRLAATAQELSKLGARIEETPDGFLIQGVERLAGGATVWSHGDHRIAMMLAVAATVCQESIYLEDYPCVRTSYPGFFRDFTALGGKADEWTMG